ncbi:tRNA-splicing endonuclease subunit sen54, partial [Ascosphaera atra]
MGRADSINRIWLLPEEALYLIERGSLDVRWPASDPVSVTVTMPDGRQQTIIGSVEADDGSGGVPMSLQAAYAMLLGRAGLNKERYTVYTGLRRGGYTVMRAGSWYGEDNESDFEGVKGQEGEYLQEIATRMKEKEQKARSEMGVCDGLRRMFTKIIRSITGHNDIAKPSTSKQTTCWTSRGPLIGLGLYRDYPSIFRALSLIPTPTINKPTPPTPAAFPPVQQSYTIHFHVYKPSTPYRKSAPPPPDFRLCVINARKETCIPSLAALDGLLARTPLDPPRGERMERLMYLRLRQGMRNVILAVVDQG